MAVQHFEVERPQSTANMLKGGYEVANAGYAAQQKQLMNQLMAKHVDAEGNLNQKGFYQDASKAGLDHEHYNMAMDWRGKQIGAMKSELDLSGTSQMYGANPQAAGRNQASFGAPTQAPMVVRPDSNTQESLLDERPDTSEASKNPLAAAIPVPAVTQPTQPTQAEPTPATTGLSDTAKPLAPAMKSWWDSMKAMKSSDEGKLPIPEVSGTQYNVPAKMSKSQLAKFLGMPQAVGDTTNMQPEGDIFGPSGVPDVVPQPVAPQADGQQVNVTADQNFQSKGEEAKLPLPPVPDTVYSQPQGDNRTFDQRFADSIQGFGAGTAMGANGQGGSGKYFQISQQTAPATIQTVATSLQRNGLLDANQATNSDAINLALKQAQDADYAAIGPAPGIQGKDGKPDVFATQNAQREYMAKFAAVHQGWVNKYGKEYADQLAQTISSDNNNRATLQLNNEARMKNAENQGFNTLLSNISKDAVKMGNKSGVQLDPTTFGDKKDADTFGKRVAAFQKIVPKPRSLEEVITNGKNFSFSEGLSEAEGTAAMLHMLGAVGLSQKLQVALAHGAKLDVPTLAAIGGQNLLAEGNGLDFSVIMPHMSINKEVDYHRGTGAQPTVGGYGQEAPVAPAQAQPSEQQPTPGASGSLAPKPKEQAKPKAAKPLAGRTF